VFGASYREFASSGQKGNVVSSGLWENIKTVPIPGFEHFLFFHQPPFRPQIVESFEDPEFIMLKTSFLIAWMVASGFANHVTPRQGINVDSAALQLLIFPKLQQV
jgi:hypothetical protein